MDQKAIASLNGESAGTEVGKIPDKRKRRQLARIEYLMFCFMVKLSV